MNLEEPRKSTLALLNKTLKWKPNDWQVGVQVVEVLEPFEQLNELIRGESYVCASSVIITNSLDRLYNETMSKEDLQQQIKEVISAIIGEIKTRFGDIENSNTLIVSAFLDL